MKCYKCGSELNKSYFNYESGKKICQNCFNYLYWDTVLNDPKTLIINGTAYFYTDNPKDGGYGQNEFIIQILNTNEIKKVGLWMNGKIPSEYRKEDNAKFITN